MKKHLISLVACLAVVLFSIPACQKDNDPAPKTNTEKLSASSWTLFHADASGTDVTNNAYLACFKDNTITFAANGTFTVAENAVVCSPSTAGSFTWNFQTNETVLVLSAPLFPGGSSTFNVVSLTETELVVSQSVTIPPNPTAILVTFTFHH
jgi:hypothetical protein